jgi:hypothetical protein
MKPGIRQPDIVPAARVRLADQAEVIGVTAAGEHRAYALSAFPHPTSQLVNDLIGDVPVTVSYCIKQKRHRVFTSDQRGSPLDVWLVNAGGEDDLVLKIGEFSYSQKSGQPLQQGAQPLPLKELPATRTTWKDWKHAHPDTDAYVEPPGLGRP